MSFSTISDEELIGYLDEALPVERMAEIERELRSRESLRLRAAAVAQRRDAGVHSVGAIWRRERLSCPDRSQLGSFVMGTLPAEQARYLDFHLQTVSCRYCNANLADLESALQTEPATQTRRRKIFASSAGYLRGKSDAR